VGIIKAIYLLMRAFLANHVPDIAACDFFTVPTVTFRVPYVFIVFCHNRRQVVHFNVTSHPHTPWGAPQIVDAFPYEEAPQFLLRDRNGIDMRPPPSAFLPRTGCLPGHPEPLLVLAYQVFPFFKCDL